MNVWVVIVEPLNADVSVRVFHERDNAVAYARSYATAGNPKHNHETHGTGGFLTIETDRYRLHVIPQTVS